MAMKKIKDYFVPSTKLGKWSLGLIIIFIILMIIVNIIVSVQGLRSGKTFLANPRVSIPVLLAYLSAISSFFTGLISIIWKKERAIPVFIAALIGLLVLWFVVSEILMPY